MMGQMRLEGINDPFVALPRDANFPLRLNNKSWLGWCDRITWIGFNGPCCERRLNLLNEDIK